MTAAYRLTPKAREGFLEIALYVEEQFGSDVADRVVTELEEAFDLLATNPAAGHKREDLTEDEAIRFWSVGPTLIAYRARPTVVEILFVERGSIDWERLLREHVG